jgi:large subunit ribosomal protein L24
MSVRSKKPSKQRLAVYKSPKHIKKKLLTAPVSPELRAKYGIRRMTVRKGDTVRILRGEWKGHEGKVISVDYEKVSIHVDGVTVRKADGTPVYYPVHPSNVLIIRLDLSDKKRRKIIERRTGREVQLVEEPKEEGEKEKVEETSAGEKASDEEVNKVENKSEGGV